MFEKVANNRKTRGTGRSWEKRATPSTKIRIIEGLAGVGKNEPPPRPLIIAIDGLAGVRNPPASQQTFFENIT